LRKWATHLFRRLSVTRRSRGPSAASIFGEQAGHFIRQRAAAVRSALFMAAMVAARHNPPPLKVFRDKAIATG